MSWAESLQAAPKKIAVAQQTLHKLTLLEGQIFQQTKQSSGNSPDWSINDPAHLLKDFPEAWVGPGVRIMVHVVLLNNNNHAAWVALFFDESDVSGANSDLSCSPKCHVTDFARRVQSSTAR